MSHLFSENLRKPQDINIRTKSLPKPIGNMNAYNSLAGHLKIKKMKMPNKKKQAPPIPRNNVDSQSHTLYTQFGNFGTAAYSTGYPSRTQAKFLNTNYENKFFHMTTYKEKENDSHGPYVINQKGSRYGKSINMPGEGSNYMIYSHKVLKYFIKAKYSASNY